MITEWFLSIAQAVVTWLLGLFPDWTPPADWSDLAGFLATASSWLNGLSVWFPIGVISTCVGVALAAWLIPLLIKGIRWLVGLIPTMGGGT